MSIETKINEYLALEQRLSTARTNIANSIIEMEGEVSNGDGFEDFSNDILTIPQSIDPTHYEESSNAVGGTTVEITTGTDCVHYDVDADVVFFDYDGSVIYSCSIAEANAMTALPTPPDHSSDTVPLTFLTWNWTLAEVNSIDSPADIGAIYKPTDGKVHFFSKHNKDLSQGFVFYKSGGSLTISWGDGETTTQEPTNYVPIEHTYARAGIYHITVEGVDDAKICFTYDSDVHTNYASYSSPIKNPECLIGTVYLPSDSECDMHWLSSWWAGFTQQMINVDYFICGFSTAPTCQDFIGYGNGIKHFNLNFTPGDGAQFFSECYRVKYISLPKDKMALPPAGSYTAITYGFHSCPALQRLRFQNSAIALSGGGRGLFVNCQALKEINNFELVNNTTLGLSSFKDLWSLKSFTISANYTGSISTSTFLQNSYCLEDLYVYPETPPTLSSVINWGNFSTLNKNNANFRIHVPADSLTAYQEATNWSTYSSYMVGDL